MNDRADGGRGPDRGGAQSLAELMTAVARRLRSEREPVEATLEVITSAAISAVPGADSAGVSFVGQNRIRSRAATGQRPAELDALQDRLGEGPCYAAIREQEVVHVSDMTAEQRWPRFAAAAAGRGVGSMLALRLWVSGDRLGALNLYARTPGSFDEESEAVARIFAVHAAIALAAAERDHRLEASLRTRDRLAQARGILMERYRLSSDQAFVLLVRAAEQSNRRLRDIAEEITDTDALSD